MRASALVAALLVAGSVRAAPPDATAQALFRKGRDLVAKGDWDAGCGQLRASNERFEAASTTLNLARCAEHFGKVASAWALYQRGRTLAGEEPTQRRAELERLAETGMREMEPRLPRLRVELLGSPEGATAEEAGHALPLGQDVPLDPGAHEVVVQAPGYERHAESVTLEEGKTVALSVTLVKVVPEPEPEPESTTRRRPASNVLPKPVQEEPARRSSPDTEIPAWIWISSAAGVVLTGAAIGFGLDANAQSRKLERKCGSDFVCNEDPSYDPGPTNARKNRDIGLAVGLGGAGLVGIGAAIFGLTQLRANATATPAGFWISAGTHL